MSLIAGCSQDTATAAEPVVVTKDKVAVVYYSWSPDGNTRFAAETIAKASGGSLFEIKAKKPYPSDYQACVAEAKVECGAKSLREIEPIAGLDLTKYDVIFVGSPNWWGTMAPPVRTWVTQNLDALKGKTLCLFQTHGGGGMQNLARDFEVLAGSSAKILPAKAFSGYSVKSNAKAIEDFVAERISAER